MKLSLLVLAAVALATHSHAKVLRGPVPLQSDTFLRIQGDKFMYGDDIVYLSGTNPAWISYGYDFGNNHWDTSTGAQWTQTIQDIGNAGGNSVRIWVHIEGEDTPEFDSNGYVTAPDAQGTMVSDLRKLLDVCQQSGVFANLVLWNGALMRPQHYKDLFFDDDKLNSYVNNALIPMVQGLKDHPALGAWEVMNEPEGSAALGVHDPDPCFDLTHLEWTKEDPYMRAPGWSGANVPMKNLLRFINFQASAIHLEDPKALVSTGSWSPWPQCNTDIFDEDAVHKSCFNHYTPDCLIKAGGNSYGVMDFWQIHTYPYNGVWVGGAPWTGLTVSDYNFSEPLVLGEFPTKVWEQHNAGNDLPNGDTTEDLVEYLYVNEFNGGWSWDYGMENDAEQDADCLAGLTQLEGRTDHGLVDVTIQ